MKLEWMGEYRDVVEALIHYCNRYSASYKAEKLELFGINFSFAQIQVLEYLLENEDLCQNMSQIAERLGISRSNFTKIIHRLASPDDADVMAASAALRPEQKALIPSLFPGNAIIFGDRDDAAAWIHMKKTDI